MPALPGKRHTLDAHEQRMADLLTQAVYNVYGLTPGCFGKKKSGGDIDEARLILYHLLVDDAGLSWSQVGLAMGRTHSTVYIGYHRLLPRLHKRGIQVMTEAARREFSRLNRLAA